MRMGEQWDDAKELSELLQLPSVQKNLQKANDDGLWNQVAGKWSNKITKWMQDSGISGDSPTATAVARIQRMSSEERKTFMGVAVTKLELQSALAWMPSAGDSFETIVNKTNLMAHKKPSRSSGDGLMCSRGQVRICRHTRRRSAFRGLTGSRRERRWNSSKPNR